MQDQTKILSKVVIVGPTINGKGGISSVLSTYMAHIPCLRFRCTNSERGTIAGMFVLSGTMIKLIADRLSGRKVVHVHYASGKSWIRKKFLMRYARMLGYKVVTHCHAAQMDKFTHMYGAERLKKVLSKAKVNIVLSTKWKDFFDREIGCGNVEIVNNIVSRPVNLLKDSNSPLATFLFLGAIGERKGVYDLLKAVAMLKQSGYSFKLIVGGNGEVERFLKEVQGAGLEDVVDFRGWISGDQKDELLRNSDVLLLPSYAEGLPISILEAMSYGRAIIATPVGGIPEVVKDGINGIMVEPGNIDAIAEAMERYIKDVSLSSQHGEESLKIVRPYYASAVRSRLVELYARALES